MRLTERDLADLGLHVDPENPDQVISVHGEAVPSGSWDLDRLAEYGIRSLGRAKVLQDQAKGFARCSSREIYRAGHALSLAKPKLKEEHRWYAWLAEKKIPRTNADEAILVFERVPSEEEAAKWTPSELKKHYRIYRERKQATEIEARQSHFPEDEGDVRSEPANVLNVHEPEEDPDRPADHSLHPDIQYLVGQLIRAQDQLSVGLGMLKLGRPDALRDMVESTIGTLRDLERRLTRPGPRRPGEVAAT